MFLAGWACGRHGGKAAAAPVWPGFVLCPWWCCIGARAGLSLLFALLLEVLGGCISACCLQCLMASVDCFQIPSSSPVRALCIRTYEWVYVWVHVFTYMYTYDCTCVSPAWVEVRPTSLALSVWLQVSPVRDSVFC